MREGQCSQTAIRVLDLTALLFAAAAAGLLGLWGGAGDGPAGERDWTDLAFAAAGGAMMVGALAATLLRRPDEDEYARRLVGQAAMIGFYVAITGFVIWLPLADGWVAAPTGDQVMGLLLAGTGLGYLIARLRGVW